eukprot:scaffold7381_cov310-Pinguiococcus_pyrenoidosus.AAC.44
MACSDASFACPFIRRLACSFDELFDAAAFGFGKSQVRSDLRHVGPPLGKFLSGEVRQRAVQAVEPLRRVNEDGDSLPLDHPVERQDDAAAIVHEENGNAS